MSRARFTFPLHLILSFCTVDTDIAKEKSALGTALANSPALGICLTVDFVFLQSFRYSGLIKELLSLTQEFISKAFSLAPLSAPLRL